MPAVGVPVTLRILSAPEPREHRPRSWIASTMATALLRLDLADLQVGAGGDVGVAAAVALGEIGEAGELPGVEDAVGDAQPAHIGILVRRDVEQAEEAPAEIVRRLRIFVLGGLLLQPLVAVERMLLALELFLVGELAAGCEHAVLRLECRRVGADRLRRRGAAAPARAAAAPAMLARRLGDLHAGDEAFEIALLFGVEIAGRSARLASLRSASLIRPALASAPRAARAPARAACG